MFNGTLDTILQKMKQKQTEVGNSLLKNKILKKSENLTIFFLSQPFLNQLASGRLKKKIWSIDLKLIYTSVYQLAYSWLNADQKWPT